MTLLIWTIVLCVLTLIGILIGRLSYKGYACESFERNKIDKYKSQYNNLDIHINDKIHDRFIIIDDNILYHCGASFKDLGKKCFAINKIDDILESVVANGNASKAYSENVTNHGKTATAQSGWYENGREITHTWFCGYFSHNNRTYVAVIFKEDGTSGAVDCAPVFKEISENIVKTSTKK